MIPDGTKFPSKTNAYGRKTRYEIATSTEGGTRSTVHPADQRTRGGVQWAYDTREAAQLRCNQLNEDRARGLINDGVEGRTWVAPPGFYEDQVKALAERGEYRACAIAYEMARAVSIGHTRRDSYERCAKHYRDLDAQRYREAYKS